MKLYFKFKTAEEEIQIDLPSLDIHELGITEAGILIEKDGVVLKAYAFPYEEDYPGIYIDGISGNHQFCLANVELPNESYPQDFAARLYAGCEEYECDSPIALVKSNCQGQRPNGDSFSEGENLTKIVYVDTDFAQFRPWREDGRPEPEHAEDV